MSMTTMQRNERLANEVFELVCYFVMDIDNTDNARKIANDIIKTIDWEDKALMHKGLSWITKNYLAKQGYIH